jgi:hypothetical protein
MVQGLIGRAKPIISKFQCGERKKQRVNKKKGPNSWKPNWIWGKEKSKKKQYVPEFHSFMSEIDEEELIEEEIRQEELSGFEDEHELDNWTSWANKIALQDEGGRERGTGDSEYDLKI